MSMSGNTISSCPDSKINGNPCFECFRSPHPAATCSLGPSSPVVRRIGRGGDRYAYVLVCQHASFIVVVDDEVWSRDVKHGHGLAPAEWSECGAGVGAEPYTNLRSHETISIVINCVEIWDIPSSSLSRMLLRRGTLPGFIEPVMMPEVFFPLIRPRDLHAHQPDPASAFCIPRLGCAGMY